MRIEVSVEIDRSPDVVWPILVDIERWPEWTPSVRAVERLDRTPFGIGTRVRIQQPKLKPMVWQVTDFQPGYLFTWRASSVGIVIDGYHTVRASSRGSVVTLALKQTGWLSPVVEALFGNISRRYVEMEAQGLKRRCEAVAARKPHEG
jgi:uncharacterized membrane protein